MKTEILVPRGGQPLRRPDERHLSAPVTARRWRWWGNRLDRPPAFLDGGVDLVYVGFCHRSGACS